MNTTICSHCNKEFENNNKLAHHRWNVNNPEWFRKWRKEHPESRKASVDKYNQKAKDKKRQWHEKKWFGRVMDINMRICVNCGNLKDLIIHHIDGHNGRNGKPANNDLDNLVILCRSCHPRFHNRWGVKELILGNV